MSALVCFTVVQVIAGGQSAPVLGATFIAGNGFWPDEIAARSSAIGYADRLAAGDPAHQYAIRRSQVETVYETQLVPA